MLRRRWAVLFVVSSLGWALGCGGQTGSDAGAGGSGAAQSGGSASGGTSSGGSASGGTSSGGTSSGGTSSGGSAAGGSGGVDCSLIGCGAPTACGEPCGSPCGCCPCAEGEIIDAGGKQMICQGGCYVPLKDKLCGGYAGLPCAPDEWCDLPNGCGYPDATGVCKKRPQGCTADCPGVCGCDGKVYCNTCSANALGVDVDTSGGCTVGDAGVGTSCQTDGECQPGLKCCYPCGIPGCQNTCMAPEANGQCPMFP